MKERPHTIKGEIGAGGKILSMTCSCKAGLSEMWKHIVGVLLYVTRWVVLFVNNSCCSWTTSSVHADTIIFIIAFTVKLLGLLGSTWIIWKCCLVRIQNAYGVNRIQKPLISIAQHHSKNINATQRSLE